MRRRAFGRLVIIALFLVATTAGSASESPGKAMLLITVRDPAHPGTVYQSTPDSFFVQIFACDGQPLVRDGVDYGTFPGAPMTIPGPMGGRVQIDLEVPSGCYLVRALGRCKNVISDWAYVEVSRGATVHVNLVLPTVRHCLLRMAASLRLATIDPAGQEDRLVAVWPNEVSIATDGLLAVAQELPDDSPDFPEAPDFEEIVELPDERGPAHSTDTGCCGGGGEIFLDLASLPYPVGNLPPLFTYAQLTFAQIYETIEFSGSSLICSGSELVGETSHDASVRLNLGALPCTACSVTAEVDAHGHDAILRALAADGSVMADVCRDGRCTLSVTGSATNPIIVIELSGQQAAWFWVKIE